HPQRQQQLQQDQGQPISQGHLLPSSIPSSHAPQAPEAASSTTTTPLTLSAFKDAKAFEDYKHRMFILEHQRLQQLKEQSDLSKQQQQQKS
ncbi:hypothetical protein BGZ98_007626, partial [Dissophora globulifera]